MSTELKTDTLIAAIEAHQQVGKCTKADLERLRELALDVHTNLEQLYTRLAYEIRDSRETWKTINTLEASGLIDRDQYDAANNLVLATRHPDHRFTDVATIEKDLIKYRGEMKQHPEENSALREQLKQPLDFDITEAIDELNRTTDKALWRMFKIGVLTGIVIAAAALMLGLVVAQHIYV